MKFVRKSNPHTLRAARKPGGNQGNKETMAPWFPGFPPPGFRWSESGVLTVQNHVFGPSQARFETCSKTSGFIGKKVCFSRRKPGVHPPLEAKLATFFGPERGGKAAPRNRSFSSTFKGGGEAEGVFLHPSSAKHPTWCPLFGVCPSLEKYGHFGSNFRLKCKTYTFKFTREFEVFFVDVSRYFLPGPSNITFLSFSYTILSILSSLICRFF